MFNVGGVRISFNHLYADVLSSIYLGENFSRFTECIIESDDEEVFFGDGVAMCMREDNFSKAFGRKLSLTRALQDAGFPRDFRKAVWAVYWDMVKK